MTELKLIRQDSAEISDEGRAAFVWRRRYPMWLAAMLMLACVSCGRSEAPRGGEPLLWGSLQPGPYHVGFRLSLQEDPAPVSYHRSALNASALRRIPDDPRPILVAMWYPTTQAGGRQFSYQRYLDPVLTGGERPQFIVSLQSFASEVLCTTGFNQDCANLDKTQQERRRSWLASRTAAMENPPVAKGRFPTVIYFTSAGGTYQEDSVLFEYLASQGYVVLSTAYQSENGSTISNDRSGLNTRIKDAEFLLRWAVAQGLSDSTRIAALGHSFGAQTALLWAVSPDEPLAAVISLDTTAENLGLDHPGFAYFRNQLSAGSENGTPILQFASTHENAKHVVIMTPKFETFDPYFQYSPRYLVTVPALYHDGYLSEGQISPSMRDPRTRGDYDAVCRRVLTFLNAYLLGQESARIAITATVPGDPLQVRFEPALALPMPGRQIANSVYSQGLIKTEAVIRQHRDQFRNLAGDPSMDDLTVSLIEATRILLQEQHPADAIAVSQWAKQNPRDFFTYELRAQAHVALGKKSEALASFRLALHAIELWRQSRGPGTSPDKSNDPSLEVYRRKIEAEMTALSLRK